MTKLTFYAIPHSDMIVTGWTIEGIGRNAERRDQVPALEIAEKQAFTISVQVPEGYDPRLVRVVAHGRATKMVGTPMTLFFSPLNVEVR